MLQCTQTINRRSWVKLVIRYHCLLGDTLACYARVTHSRQWYNYNIYYDMPATFYANITTRKVRKYLLFGSDIFLQTSFTLFYKMPRYRRDHSTMRPIHECPENNVGAKSVDDCARISTLRLITIRRWNYFRSIPSNVIAAPNSDLNVTDGQTDGHCGITAR